MINSYNSKTAMRLIILLGLVSLFSDMTYEAARSIVGPYLAILGASGAVVGFVAGAGEFAGYGLRLISGLLSDKTRQYWLLTIVGYLINLFAVPLLALANHWQLAASLIITERIGKAIRTPARDVILSAATSPVSRGWGFAIHEAMDQIGAMTGPFIVMIILAIKGSYKYAFAALTLPACIAIAILIIARINFPHPQRFEESSTTNRPDNRPSLAFWIYLIATGFLAAGFADYPLIAFHIKSRMILEDKWIPLLYACVMGIDALSALVFGRLYDKKGLLSLAAAIIISSPFALFAFSDSVYPTIIGLVLWGIGMGSQESIVRAAVADLTPQEKRGTAFGLFNAIFGFSWFLGSAIMGILYDISITSLIVLSISSQLASIPLLIKTRSILKATIPNKR